MTAITPARTAVTSCEKNEEIIAPRQIIIVETVKLPLAVFSRIRT